MEITTFSAINVRDIVALDGLHSDEMVIGKVKKVEVNEDQTILHLHGYLSIAQNRNYPIVRLSQGTAIPLINVQLHPDQYDLHQSKRHKL